MSLILWVEGSLCMRTGAAGWGAVLSDGAPRGGPLFGDFAGATTLMELAAVAAACASYWRHNGGPAELALASRSTNALAVLRWVFPEAPLISPIPIHPPKRLKRVVAEFPPLYDLSDQLDGVRVSLQLAPVSDPTETAQALARMHMSQARPERRSAR